MGMELKIRATGPLAIGELSGRFDTLENAKVSAWLDTLLANNPGCILLNMSNVTFVDSSALSLLVKYMKTCRQNNGDLIICGLQSHVRVIFDLTRLDKVFRIFPTEEEALHALPS